jgi:hypothetical protein
MRWGFPILGQEIGGGRQMRRDSLPGLSHVIGQGVPRVR